MRLMLWKREFKEKPEIVLSREMHGKMVKGHITNKIGESVVDVGIEELADITGNKGCCFHPAWMIDGMATENFTHTSLFVLDFDADKETGKADLEFSRFMEICSEYNIYPAFCYETFSGLPRFRAVFQVSGIVSELKLWKLCQLGLMKLFDDACDPACKNITQRYFGGKRLICENHGAFLDPVKLIEAVERKIRSEDVSGHAARAITAFCNSSGIDMVNGSPHIYYHEDENKMAMYYLTDIKFNVKWAEGKPKNVKVEREYIDIKDAVEGLNNQLHTQLSHSFPSYKEFFSDIDCKVASAFWDKYPSPQHLKDVEVEELAVFLRKNSHNNCSTNKAKLILSLIEKDNAPQREFQETRDFLVKSLVADIIFRRQEIIKIESEMEKVLDILGYKLETMPGIDTVTAAALIAEIGDVTRFATPDKLARFSGIAPVNFSSAGKGTDQKSKQGNRVLHGIFYFMAVQQIQLARGSKQPRNAIFHAYYERKIAEGKTKVQALICIMRRLVNIIYGMLKNKTEYIMPTIPEDKSM